VPDNGEVRGARGYTVAAVAVCLLALTGCTTHPPVLPDQTPSGPVATGPSDPWGQLAARVAALRDDRYVAAYSLTTRGREARTVTVTIATDGSWLVVIPGGALSGTADIALASTPSGMYECATTRSPGSLSASAPPGCYLVGKRDTVLPARNDPRVQHVFTDWLQILTNRDEALSVVSAAPLPGAKGQCFSIEANSATLGSPVDPGIYCFDAGGTLTAAALAMGTLMLASAPAAAPPSVTLPGPVVPGSLLPLTAPPPPSTSPSASPSHH
jgi:hypothetical protein